MTGSQSNYFFYLLTGDTGNHLSNPLPVIRFMEKEMPEVWEKYCMSMLGLIIGRYYYTALNDVLDLSNLITYLSDHREWGEKECPRCIKGQESSCFHCKGSGIIKHPALIYLEGCDDLKHPRIVCPYPVDGDDGTMEDCVTKGHCGCGGRPISPTRRRR